MIKLILNIARMLNWTNYFKVFFYFLNSLIKYKLDHLNHHPNKTHLVKNYFMYLARLLIENYNYLNHTNRNHNCILKYPNIDFKLNQRDLKQL